MLLKHSGFYLVSEIIPVLLAFISISVYTRYLTTEEYALYSLVMTTIWLSTALLIDWLKMSLVRFWNMADISKKVLLGTIYSLSNLILLGVSLVFILLGYFIFEYLSVPISIIFAGMLLFITQSLFDLNMKIKTVLFQAKEYTFIGFFRAIISVSIGILLVINGFGTIGLIISLIVAYITLLLFTSGDTWKYFKSLRFDQPLAQRLLKYGVPVSLATMLQTIANTSDRFLIVWLDSLSASGIYSVANSMLGTSLSMLLYSLSVAAYPIVLKALEDNDPQEVKNKLNQYAAILFGFALPAVVGLIAIAPNLLSLLIGEKFLEGSLDVFPWLALSELFYGLQAFYFAMAFQISKKTMNLVWIMLASAGSNIILNILFIPEYGIIGAAVATVISSFLGGLLTYIYGRKLYKLPLPWNDIFKIIMSSLVMFISLYVLGDETGWGWLVLQVFLGALVYFICIMSFNVANVYDEFNKVIRPKVTTLFGRVR